MSEYYGMSRYFDELVGLKCVSDLLNPNLKLFPNAKEITESFGMYNAVRKHLRGVFKFSDPEVDVVVVGDGHRPRTGALFAFRSRWNCVSVDPALRDKKYGIHRLEIKNKKIEDVYLTLDRKTLIILPHAHVNLDVCMKSFDLNGQQVAVIAMPCCVKQERLNGQLPDIDYSDFGILSPERRIKIWKLF